MTGRQIHPVALKQPLESLIDGGVVDAVMILLLEVAAGDVQVCARRPTTTAANCCRRSPVKRRAPESRVKGLLATAMPNSRRRA